MEKQALVPCQNLRGRKWYLNNLAVEKARQGKGIGTRFIQEYIIPHVKENGGEVLCLFTNSEINRRFYDKNSFTLFDEREFELNTSEEFFKVKDYIQSKKLMISAAKQKYA